MFEIGKYPDTSGPVKSINRRADLPGTAAKSAVWFRQVRYMFTKSVAFYFAHIPQLLQISIQPHEKRQNPKTLYNGLRYRKWKLLVQATNYNEV